MTHAYQLTAFNRFCETARSIEQRSRKKSRIPGKCSGHGSEDEPDVAIEKNATQERTKKKTELWEKQQRYRELMALSSKPSIPGNVAAFPKARSFSSSSPEWHFFRWLQAIADAHGEAGVC
jgi:hypothetical protein